MSETTENPDGTPAPEPEPKPVPDTPAPETEEPEQKPQREADEEGRRVAQLRARLGAQERENARKDAELEFYRRQAQQQTPAEETPEQRYMRERATIRAEVEQQIRTERFHEQGQSAYGDWKQRCDDLVAMGADAGMAALLVEMPDGVKVAASLAGDPGAAHRQPAQRAGARRGARQICRDGRQRYRDAGTPCAAGDARTGTDPAGDRTRLAAVQRIHRISRPAC
jgi:hypothetical protein